MENENEAYVASVKSPATSTDPIIKDVTEKLYGEPRLTVRELIDYVIKDDGNFSEDDKNIMHTVNGSLNLVDNSQNQPDKLKQELVIRALGENGDYKSFTNSLGENKELIEPGEIAKDYFESRTIDGKEYNHLDLEVHHKPKGALGLDYLLMK